MPRRNPVHRARTVAKIRQLTLVGGVKPRRVVRWPRPRHPDAVALEFFKAVLPVCESARSYFRLVEPEILRLLAQHRRDLRLDAAGPAIAARHLVDQAAARAADAFAPDELHQVAKKFGKRTTEFQKEQLDRQLKSAIGIPFSALEKPVLDKIEGWAALNVDLIKTVPERYFDRLRLDVEEAFAEGTHPDELAESFEERYGMQEDDARRIAVDQTLKLSAQVNEERLTSLGVERYIWRVANDQRMCEECEPLDGEEFSFDEPPGDGGPGEIHPCCRCFAEPVLDDILASLEEQPSAE